MAEQFRFRYVDNNGDDQIIASNVGDGAQIDNVKQTRRFRDTHKIMVWGDIQLFNAFPQDKTNFQSNEPEIFFEQPDGQGGWETKKRVYAKDSGNIKNKDTCKVKLYGFYRYNSKQPVDIGTISTDIVDVLEAMANDLDGDYFVEAPAEANVDGGYPSVDGYSANNNAAVVLNDVTRELSNWSVRFLDETDNSGNYIIRAEPKGFGGAVDTLDSNTTGLRFESWNKEKTENIVNKVEVIGTDDSGNKITSAAKNQFMIDRYGEKFESIKVGYLASQSDADQIANNRLVPGKDSNGDDIEDPPESGKVSLPTLNFDDGVENDSFNIVDSDLGIDDTFTCVTQHLFYPSGRSELVFEFEQERLEDRAQKDNYLGDERARLLPSQQKNLGSQTIDTDNSNTTTASADLSKSGDVDNGNTGVATAQDPAVVPKDASAFSKVTFNIDVPDDPIGNNVIGADVMYSYTNQSGGNMGIRYSIKVNGIEVESGEANSPSDELYVEDGSGIIQNFDIGNLSEGDTITIQLTSLNPSTFTADSLFETASGKLFLTDFMTAVTSYTEYQINNNIQFGDQGHGNTTDASTHNLEGLTVEELVDLINEEKTNR